jgi:hypothetical protein
VSTLSIENKEYVVLPKKDYEALLSKAARKATPARKLDLNDGKKLAYRLIDKWAKGK